jgi:hypothetical protein
MINRSFTRAILNGVEVTDKTRSVASSALTFELTTAQYLYLGFRQPFTTRYFDMATSNTNACTLTAEFWTGSAWKAVEDLIDETAGFTKSGFISWLNMGLWQYSTQSPVVAANSENSTQIDIEYYWMRIKVSANLSTGTTLQSITNIFCHDLLFGTYYPDILADSRYLPAGRDNFMEQYVAAKDHVVRRMRQMAKITDEGDLLDINDVAVAACHATAYIILNPIARDDESRAVASAAYKACEAELERGTQAVDTNKDGKIESEERYSGTTFLGR